MRIVGTGSLIAMPFAATMMADFGAEVIQIERPGVGDTYRSFPPVVSTEKGSASSSWIQDARNRLSLTLELDLRDPDVKEIFLKLIAESDIYIENMVWLEKLGIRDEELLSVNPGWSSSTSQASVMRSSEAAGDLRPGLLRHDRPGLFGLCAV